jgi:hypothetical protein
MLLGKLKEPVEKIYQGMGLETTVVTGEYLAVSAMTYVMGVTHKQFYYKIGKVNFDNSGVAINFDPVIRGFIELTSEEFSEWGTDDFVMLEIVANKLGIELVDRLIMENEIFKT